MFVISHFYNLIKLRGHTGGGVVALKKHPKVRSVTPQKRVERFPRSVQGTTILLVAFPC